MSLDMSSGLIYGVIPVVAIPVVLTVYAYCSGRRDKAAHGAYAALHSPSVRDARNAFDRRVAVAMREAKMGFQTCRACGFTNAMRVETCVLCGASELKRARPGAERRGVASWWRAQTERKGIVGSGGRGSARQRRIRRRKEWVRHVDEQDQVVWQHTASEASSPRNRGFPSFVLHTTRQAAGGADTDPAQAQPLEEPKAVNSDDTLEIVTVATEVSSSTESALVTTDQVVAAIDTERGQISVEVVEISSANGAHIAYGVSTFSFAQESTFSVADSARNALLDFPTKIAQFITSTASIFASQAGDDASASGSTPAVRLSINRTTLLADSMAAIATMNVPQARAGVRVEFLGEQGIDAGGVYREWFLLLNEAIVKPEAGIFVCVDPRDQTFYLNPQSRTILGEDHLIHFLAAGRVLGRALLEGNVSGFHLAQPLLKIILGLPIGFSDLANFDPEAHKNLQWLLDNDGVDALCLDFTVTEVLPNGQTHEVELVPGGSQIDVTDANKREFVELKVKYLFFDSVQSQLFAFLKGLYEIVPAELLTLFDAEELDYVLSGSDEIDVDDWERSTIISKNLAYFPAAGLFWKVIRELSQDERRQFLQFATGSTRVPPGGFSALTSNDGRLCLFSLRGVEAKETRGYLHSHACFNRVDLPLHRKLKDMREAVRAAIAGESIGFTTD